MSFIVNMDICSLVLCIFNSGNNFNSLLEVYRVPVFIFSTLCVYLVYLSGIVIIGAAAH